MKKYCLLLFVCATTLLRADDIYLKNGYVVRNVKILDLLNNKMHCQVVPKSERTFLLSSVDKIISIPFDSLLQTEFFTDAKNIKPAMRRREYDYPNLKLIPISLISFAFSYNYFFSASLQPDDQKHKVIVPGAMFLAAGVINLIFVFEKVEVRTTPNSLSLSYNF